MDLDPVTLRALVVTFRQDFPCGRFSDYPFGGPGFKAQVLEAIRMDTHAKILSWLEDKLKATGSPLPTLLEPPPTTTVPQTADEYLAHVRTTPGA